MFFFWWDRDWIRSFFSYRFVFWKKQNLLALYSDLDYYRRDILYMYIYDNLQIDKLIFGEKGNFIEFVMSPINSAETNDNFYQILKKYIKEPSEDKIEDFVKELFDFYTLELRKEKVDDKTFMKKFAEYRNRKSCQR